MKITESFISKKIAIPLFGFLFLLSTGVTAQISISPTSLVFDNQNRFGSLTISNSSSEAQEITISMEFGYPTSENGNLVIKRDSILAEQKSLAPWLKVFPQSFTLQGQERQVVRFVLRVPQNLDPGGYWSRVKISSNPVSPPIESVGNNQVGAQINLVVEQVIAAHYRTEDANTGVEVTSVDFNQNRQEQNGILAVGLRQTGNAPFMGTIAFDIKDQEGNTVYQTQTSGSVYTDITRSFRIDLSDWETGTYTISGIITSQRRDINSQKILQIEPVSFTRQINIE